MDAEFIPIEWIETRENESIEDYAIRLSEAIDTSSDFAILGLIFGSLNFISIGSVGGSEE